MGGSSLGKDNFGGYIKVCVKGMGGRVGTRREEKKSREASLWALTAYTRGLTGLMVRHTRGVLEREKARPR